MSTRKSVSSDFRKLLGQLAHRHGSSRVFEAFVRLSTCALATQTREAEYLEEVSRWQSDELDLFAAALGALVLEMESYPFTDIIGGYYTESVLSPKGQQWRGEFHTPKPVCDLIAHMVLDAKALPTDGPITVCEPACGSGAMILSLGQVCPPEIRRRLRVTAIDISRTACDMTFINTTLWGIPMRVIHGNTLSGERWAEWPNIHWLRPWLSASIRDKAQETRQQQPIRSQIRYDTPALTQQELTL